MLPVLIATRAAFATFAVVLAILAVLSVIAAVHKRPDHLGSLVGRTIGASIFLAIPLGIAFPVGVLASAALVAVGPPPITYLFVIFAALISFRAAVRHSGYGMEGCTKIAGLVWSGYAIIWSLVSFEATGGMRTLEAEAISLSWLQPPLAALPFALLVLKLSSASKRSVWLVLGTWAFVAAFMALCFFPVERGFASTILPRSDWLRFPLAGVVVVVVFTLLRAALELRTQPKIRRRRIRDLVKSARMFVMIFAAMGLSWAGARALVSAVV